MAMFDVVGRNDPDCSMGSHRQPDGIKSTTRTSPNLVSETLQVSRLSPIPCAILHYRQTGPLLPGVFEVRVI